MRKRGLAGGEGKLKRRAGLVLVLVNAPSIPLGKFLASFSPPLSYLSQKGRGVSVEIGAGGVQVTGMVGYTQSIRKCHGGAQFI